MATRSTLVVIGLVGLVGCSASEPTERSGPGDPPASTQPARSPATAGVAPIAVPPPWKGCDAKPPGRASGVLSISSVDWCNLEVIAGIVTLRDGRGEIREYEEIGGRHDSSRFALATVVYADIASSPGFEAVVVIHADDTTTRGENHERSLVRLYAVDAGKLTLLGEASTEHLEAPRVTAANDRVAIRYRQRAGDVNERCSVVIGWDGSRLSRVSGACLRPKPRP